jgi:hypothetical protein
VIQYRRLAALLLGIWLGASILADIAVTQNFRAVDRFLEAPGNASTSLALNRIGRDQSRVILRRNAGEENNWIFLNWERAEIALGGSLFLLLLFGDRPQMLSMALCLGMLAIVVAQHFFLDPMITELGRRVDDLQPNDPEVRKFWILHGFYSGLDILKMLAGFGFAVRLVFKRGADKEYIAREYAVSFPVEGKLKRG